MRSSEIVLTQNRFTLVVLKELLLFIFTKGCLLEMFNSEYKNNPHSTGILGEGWMGINRKVHRHTFSKTSVHLAWYISPQTAETLTCAPVHGDLQEMVQEDPGRTCSQPSGFSRMVRQELQLPGKPQKKKYQDTPLSQVIHSRDKPKPRDICGNYVLFSNQFLINLKKLSGDIMGYLPRKTVMLDQFVKQSLVKNLGNAPELQ